MKGSSFSATVCDSLYLLDLEGQINELTTRDFSLSDQVGHQFEPLTCCQHPILIKKIQLGFDNQKYLI